jgi:hypothetical protein
MLNGVLNTGWMRLTFAKEKINFNQPAPALSLQAKRNYPRQGLISFPKLYEGYFLK